MKRIAIIGGGISGLSAAFYLEKARAAGADLEYTLFESGQRLGGSHVLRSRRRLPGRGRPRFLPHRKAWALALCKELGIGDQLIGSNDAQRKTYIVVKGRLVVMPDGLMFMVPTQAGAHGAVAAVLVEHEDPHGAGAAASAAAHAGRRNGRASWWSVISEPEVVDRLADPLLSGVYGGDAAQAQRARRAAALRRDGREVRQPEPRHAGGAQEDGARDATSSRRVRCSLR